MRLPRLTRHIPLAACLIISSSAAATCAPEFAPDRAPTAEDVLDAKSALATLGLHLALTKNPAQRDQIELALAKTRTFIQAAEAHLHGESEPSDGYRTSSDIHEAVRRAGAYLVAPDHPPGGYRREIELFDRDVYRR